MLPETVLDLLRQWWQERPTMTTACRRRPERWLFPGRSEHLPLTTRQLSRLFQEAVAGGRHHEAGDTAHAEAQLRDAPVGRGTDIRNDPGVARPRQARDDGTLHAGGDRPDRQGREPSR